MDKNKLSSNLHKYQLKAHEIVINDLGFMNGNITPFYLDILEEYRKELSISIKDARKIESNILTLCRNYETKVEKYKSQIRKLVTYKQDILLLRNQKILKHLQKVLQINDFAVAVAYISIGHEMLNLNMEVTSIICFKEAIKYNKNNPTAYVGLGNVLYIKDRKKEALENLKKAKKLFEIQNMSDEARKIEDFIHKYNLNNNYLTKITIILKSFFLGYSPKKPFINNNVYKNISSLYNETNELKILTEKVRSLEEDKINNQKILENMSESQRTSVNMNFHGSVNSATGNVEGDQKNIFISENKQTLTEAAAEIQQLLEQLEKSYPTKTLSQQAVVAEKTIEQIEANKNWKQKVINSVKAMGIETFMELIDNPVANVLRAGIESLLEEN